MINCSIITTYLLAFDSDNLPDYINTDNPSDHDDSDHLPDYFNSDHRPDHGDSDHPPDHVD